MAMIEVSEDGVRRAAGGEVFAQVCVTNAERSWM
jgi:hypothetical protein